MIKFNDKLNDIIFLSLCVLVYAVTRLKGKRKMFYNQIAAQKFVDCFNGKCMCDKACPYAYCMIDPDCEALADDVSSLDGVTPCCKKHKNKLQQKFEAFVCSRV